MSLDALLLVVCGALMHALWNASAKQAGGGLPFVFLFGVVSSVLALPLALLLEPQALAALGSEAWCAIAASAAIHIGYSLVLQKGYQQSDFSVVYPLARGSGPLFAVFGAVLVLGERPSAPGWLGIAAVLAGILSIAGGWRLRAAAPRVRAGLLWGVLTGAFIGAYTLIDGWAVKVLGVAPGLYYGLGLLLRTLALAPVALADGAALGRQWRLNRRHVIAVGVLSPLAYVLVLTAMTRAPLAYVAPVRELSMLLGVLLGARLLREALTPARLLGAALMVGGVLLLLVAG